MDERSGIQNANDFNPHLSPFACMTRRVRPRYLTIRYEGKKERNEMS
jgi:hypothetical protein